MRHHVCPRAWAALGLHTLLLELGPRLTAARQAGQLTAREECERWNLLSTLYCRLRGDGPRYVAARLEP